MTLAGLSVGSAEKIEPSPAKHKEPRITVKIREIKLVIVPPKTKVPTKITRMEIARLKKNADRISPNINIAIEPGVVSNLSRVFVLVSQGVIKGPTEEPVKKKVIPSKPGTSSFTGIFFPKAKAKNRKKGNRIPNISIGDSV
jgi:hypothetical protein